MAVSSKFASVPAEKSLLAALGLEAMSFLTSTSNPPPTSADSSPRVLHPNLTDKTQAFAAMNLGLWLTCLCTTLTLVCLPFIQTLACDQVWIHSILLCLCLDPALPCHPQAPFFLSNPSLGSLIWHLNQHCLREFLTILLPASTLPWQDFKDRLSGRGFSAKFTHAMGPSPQAPLGA